MSELWYFIKQEWPLCLLAFLFFLAISALIVTSIEAMKPRA